LWYYTLCTLSRRWPSLRLSDDVAGAAARGHRSRRWPPCSVPGDGGGRPFVYPAPRRVVRPVLVSFTAARGKFAGRAARRRRHSARRWAQHPAGKAFTPPASAAAPRARRPWRPPAPPVSARALPPPALFYTYSVVTGAVASFVESDGQHQGMWSPVLQLPLGRSSGGGCGRSPPRKRLGRFSRARLPLRTLQWRQLLPPFCDTAATPVATAADERRLREQLAVPPQPQLRLPDAGLAAAASFAATWLPPSRAPSVHPAASAGSATVFQSLPQRSHSCGRRTALTIGACGLCPPLRVDGGLSGHVASSASWSATN